MKAKETGCILFNRKLGKMFMETQWKIEKEKEIGDWPF